MPRQENADAEDSQVQCPRCFGTTLVTNLREGGQDTCPTCQGEGRVNRQQAKAYANRRR